MDLKSIHTNNSESLLLKRFNEREHSAFGEIYSLFYDDLHRYTLYLYRDTDIDSNDVIQDIFLRLWERRDIVFDNIIKIKGFVIISIKNSFKNHIRHLKHETKYAEVFDKEFEYDVIEFELYSIVNEVMNILPKDCAEIFRLYLEGYKPNEISEIVGKQVQMIYNKKQESISLLRKKLSKDKLMMFLFLIH